MAATTAGHVAFARQFKQLIPGCYTQRVERSERSHAVEVTVPLPATLQEESTGAFLRGAPYPSHLPPRHHHAVPSGRPSAPARSAEALSATDPALHLAAVAAVVEGTGGPTTATHHRVLRYSHEQLIFDVRAPDDAVGGECIRVAVPSSWRFRASEGSASLSTLVGLADLHTAPLPPVGSLLELGLASDQPEMEYRRRRGRDVHEMGGWAISIVAEELTADVACQLLSAALVERQIVLVSKHKRDRTAVAFALLAMLGGPDKWHHTFLPLLPQEL